ncbi:MAG: DUF4011 domain-containing protein [Clostridiales bacterium]|nr:DUF4011 domain-containing protein [Clostridiales bacterium]
MEREKLDKWAELLLDTGKRNNLVNFKNTKASTVDIVVPNIVELLKRAEKYGVLEVYDPKLEGDEEIEQEDDEVKRISQAEYVAAYKPKLKSNQVLLYNFSGKPLTALNNVGKRARSAVEETGVNIAYIAMGFIEWKENDTDKAFLHAPLILMPITVVHESTIDPYRIIVSPDECIINPTFSYKLLNEQGIHLPEFDDDIDAFLSAVQADVDKLGWYVTRECKIGIFSFQKINMYRDLKDNGDIIVANPSVQIALGEVEPGSFPPPQVGEVNFNVVDADSSQLEAIALAESGASFVLQGPPGTGKSQTITNIIAEVLSNGKKVLFVSEKLAALNVVYDKLKKAGLADFCLELHSHKANKKIIIDELCRTLKANKSALSERAAREVEIKQATAMKLDGYVDELHAVRPIIGKSLYALYETYAAYRKEPDAVYAISDISSKTEEYLHDAESLLSRYVSYIESIGDDYRDNVWYGYQKPAPSFEDELKLTQSLKAAEKFNAGLTSLAAELNDQTSIVIDNAELFSAAVAFFEIAGKSEFLSPEVYSADASNVRLKAEQLFELARIIVDYKDKIDAAYTAEVYKLDGAAAHRTLVRDYSGFFKRMFGKEYKRLVKLDLRACAKDGKTPNYKKAVASYEALSVYQAKRAEFDRLTDEIKPYISGGYNDTDTDFAALVAELKALENAVKTGVDLSVLTKKTPAEYTAVKTVFVDISAQYKSLASQYESGTREAESCFGRDKFDFNRESLNLVGLKISGCIDGVDKLGNYCAFCALLSEAEKAGLKSFIDYSIEEGYGIDHTVGAYKKLFYRQWIDAVLRQSPLLSELGRLPHDEAVKLFVQKDELDFEINKAKLKAVLSEKRPALDMVARGSAVSVLLREGEKKRKQKGVRQLLSEIRDLALTLKPCFLMSPLSVSTYLDSDIQFDTIVFDEASQIFPQDAIGAVYRAKQLIVVGDSKQMPPTNFFNSVVETDDEEEDIGEFESILDICSTALPQCRLKWHYRSRYEELIAFSNRNFYDGELVTFPSAYGDKSGVGVDYCFVGNGIFDRKTKTNLEEAKAVVDLVFDNFEKFPERSVGVVAFSVAQQDLIDKLIAKRRRADQSKEKFFRSDLAEPFFVKNLETVQGDERDTIIFSVAYGKGSDGKFLHNFGPLNREGGERRLNVAVTRAKFNVKLVTGLSANDIDLKRTQSAGARLLREYIDYAERGAKVYAKQSGADNATAELFDEFEFEREVCEFLESKGYRVDTRVGCSAFKIDIAVKLPQSDDYVLAIECDGDSYRSANGTRDRDRLRTQVLERMGWKFYRLWSTDWFGNKRVEKDRLLTAIEQAKRGKSEDKDETDSDEIKSFAEEMPQKKFKLPTYHKVDEREEAKKARGSYLTLVRGILEKEAPLAEEWLLKRTLFAFGRDKMTDAVKRDYRAVMWGCARLGIVRRNGYLYIEGRETPMLRLPDGDTTREIKYICLEELANGILAVLKQNVTVNRLGLYRLLAERLGASRLTDAITERLDAALRTLTDKINIDGETLSLK